MRAVQFLSLAASGTVVLGAVAAVAQPAASTGEDRPKITLRAQPSVGMSPARIVITAELVGGRDDFEEFYCPTIEWDWDDDTVSESSSDCEPYEPEVSTIRRRYSVEHIFRRPGNFRIQLRLKQRDEVVGLGVVSVIVRARPGA